MPDEPRPPRRSEAVFTSENDHNPTVHEDCPDCRGTQGGCGSCGHTGVTGKLVPCFDNDSPAIRMSVRGDGWLSCPNCHVRFTTADPHAWTGLRHRGCGQKILIVPA